MIILNQAKQNKDIILKSLENDINAVNKVLESIDELSKRGFKDEAYDHYLTLKSELESKYYKLKFD